jgi:ribosomal protein L29
MTLINKEDIKKYSVEELMKALKENMEAKSKLGINLRSQQSHDQKSFHGYKLNIARIRTELRSRELTSQSN